MGTGEVRLGRVTGGDTSRGGGGTGGGKSRGGGIDRKLPQEKYVEI